MITNKARSYYHNIEDELISFYEEEGNKLSDRNLFIQTSIKFGDRMLKDVSIPLGLEFGECTVGAIALMKEHK